MDIGENEKRIKRKKEQRGREGKKMDKKKIRKGKKRGRRLMITITY